MPEKYLDFTLTISKPSDGSWVAELRSPAGEVQPVKLETDLGALLAELDSHPYWYGEDLDWTRKMGTRLFDACFCKEFLSRYDSSLVMAAEHQGLRIRLVLRDPDLHRLPWELIYDPRPGGGYANLSSRTPVLRYLELGRPLLPLKVKPPLRILAMIASPQGHRKLNISAEKLRLEQALAEAVSFGLVELAWVDGQTIQDLQTSLSQKACHIFHFIGHSRYNRASAEAEFVFADARNLAEIIPASMLTPLLNDSRSLRLVTLNSCEGAFFSSQPFSSAAAFMVNQGIPAVIAMQQAFADELAVEFTRVFYTALGMGKPVEACLAEAHKALFVLSQDADWAIPALYTHTLDGDLFSFGEQPAAGLILSRALSAIVEIFAGGQLRGIGFVIDSAGHILTTEYTLNAPGEIGVVVQGLRSPAGQLGILPNENLALLKSDILSKSRINLADNALPGPGETIYLIGRNPQTGLEMFHGQVVGPGKLNVYPACELLKVSLNVSRSLGGAPAFDRMGRFVGMVVMMYAEDDQVNTAYLIPARSLAALLPELGYGGKG